MTAVLAGENGTLGLRPVTALDLSVLRELFREVHGEQFASAGLSPALLTPLLDVQFQSKQAQYGLGHPDAVDSLIVLDDHVVGRCWVHRSATAVRVLDLAVLPMARRRGVASRLLSDLIDEALERGLCLHLSVWRDNDAALGLYEGLGFELREQRPDGYLELCRPSAPHNCRTIRPDGEAEPR
jgi:ribosomal protein S18 acetylase RimI-like enzyme